MTEELQYDPEVGEQIESLLVEFDDELRGRDFKDTDTLRELGLDSLDTLCFFDLIINRLKLENPQGNPKTLGELKVVITHCLTSESVKDIVE